MKNVHFAKMAPKIWRKTRIKHDGVNTKKIVQKVAA
jgi:hypothetical protein